MARYIDADALNECMSIVQKANKDSIEFNKRCRATDVFQDIWGMIKAQPTADVRENVKGEWIVTEKSGTQNYNYKCSNCGYIECHAYSDFKGNNYCPKCGARMVEE